MGAKLDAVDSLPVLRRTSPSPKNFSEAHSTPPLSSLILLSPSLQVLWNHSGLHESRHGPQQNLRSYLAGSPLTREAASERLIDKLSAALLEEVTGQLTWPASLAPSPQQAANLQFSWSYVGTPPHHQIFLRINLSGEIQPFLSSHEQQLRSQQFFINQLIHELRTPLAIAGGSIRRAGLLADSQSQDVGQHLSVAKEEVQRMRRLIDHLSLLTDVETGSKRWKFESLPFDHSLRVICSELPPEIKEHLVLFVPGPNLSRKVYAATDALSVVLTNVLENSFRYSKQPGPVLVVVTADRDSLHLYIADWGYGISPHKRDSIFDPFRRLEEHRDPSRSDGSGLGLSVCRSLLKMMNSTISLMPLMHSEDRQNYPKTVVKISLPLLSESPACVSLDARDEWVADINGGCSPALASLVPSEAHSELFRGLFDYLDRCGEPLSCAIASATGRDGVQSPFLDFQISLA